MNSPEVLTLTEIIEGNARHCRRVGIRVCRTLDHVTIIDREGVQEDIFIDGEAGLSFIVALDNLLNDAPDVTLSDALRHLAKPWVENAWA